MIKTTIKIEGMMCGMCEAHVCDAIRKAVPYAKKVKASRIRKEASFITDDAVDDNIIGSAIKEMGYDCIGIESVSYKKRSIFG